MADAEDVKTNTTEEVSTEEPQKPTEDTTTQTEEKKEEAPPEDIEPETRHKQEEKEPEEDIEAEEEEEKQPTKQPAKSSTGEQSSIERKVQTLQDQIEVDGFLRSNPQYEKYRSSILKHVSHPAYSNIPIHNIAAMVSSKDAMKMGAQKEREAQQKAKETKSGGSTVREQPKGIDWHNLTKEQYDIERAKLLGNR